MVCSLRTGVLWLMLLAFSVSAQERLYSEYEYDEVGNTTSKLQDLSGTPPSISAVSQSVVRQNQVVTFIIDGSGLRGAEVTNADGYFIFSNTQTTNEQIVTTLRVGQDALEGFSQISVSTGLGVDSVSLEILTELPVLRISPIPLVIKTGTTLTLGLSLSKADVISHSIDVSVADVNVVALNTGSLTVN